MLGRVSILTLAFAVLAVAPTYAKPVPLEAGDITLSFERAFGLEVVKLGIAPTPVAPATQDGVAFSLPVVSGDADTNRSTVRTRGGFELTDAPQGTSIRLSNPFAKLRGKKVTLQGFATIGGREIDTFVFAEGRARTVRKTRFGLTVRGIRLRLSTFASTALNSQFATTRFTTTAPLATASIDASR